MITCLLRNLKDEPAYKTKLGISRHVSYTPCNSVFSTYLTLTVFNRCAWYLLIIRLSFVSPNSPYYIILIVKSPPLIALVLFLFFIYS